jgi:parvulin-like peptidyl-prolyl isomerase
METTTEETTSLPDQPQVPATAARQSPVNLKTAIIISALIIVGALAYRHRDLLIAATVNGSPISRLTLIQELEKKSGKAALDALITQKLIDGEAQKKGVTVSSDEVNAEITKIENQLKTQGKTLDAALAAQGMTKDDLRLQIAIQKKLEKILADKTQVTDAEVDQFIKDSKVVIPAGQEASYKSQARNQLEQNKLRDAAASLIDSLKSQAKIDYLVNY